MGEHERRLAVQKAYAEAARRLRAQFDAEFRALLVQVYEERGLMVSTRASRVEVKRKQIADAKRVLAEVGAVNVEEGK